MQEFTQMLLIGVGLVMSQSEGIGHVVNRMPTALFFVDFVRIAAIGVIFRLSRKQPQASPARYQLGHDNILVYDNSMSEWGTNEELPIEID
jgi:hypothetical protein